MGLHCAYWWGTGLENDHDELIRLTAGSGVDIIEIVPGWMLDLDKAGRAALKGKFADAGLCVTVNGGLLPETDISADDPAVRARGIDYCKRALEAIHDVGAAVWSGVNFSAWLRKGVDKPQEERKRAWAHSVNSMRQIIKTAEDYGVSYCFEVVNRYEQFLFNTSRDAVDFALEVDSGSANVLLDVYHMNIEEDDMLAAIAYAAERGKLGHFHLGESNRRIPGTGVSRMDWAGIMQALKDTGYGGAVVMEPFVLPTAHNAAKTCTWRATCASAEVADLQRDAATGNNFLKNLLA